MEKRPYHESEGDPSGAPYYSAMVSPISQTADNHSWHTKTEYEDDYRRQRPTSQALLEEVQELRHMVAELTTRLNSAPATGPHPINRISSIVEEPVDKTLDPQNENFDIRQWLQMFTKGLEEQGHKGLRTGVVFKSLSISGSGESMQYQQTVTDILLAPLKLAKLFSHERQRERKILHSFNGLVRSGELLLVLGRPGSGCSTLLKALCGELHSLHVHEKSVIHYDGIPQDKMVNEFKGEVTYNQEVDKHFPHLTVGQTLEFAAACRTPSTRINGMSRNEFCQHVVRIVMAVCGLSHTYDTRVGNDFIRGVSGGERKRVSIAEMMLAGSSIAAWDNSTRGLDSATALKFVQSLRLASDIGGSANAVAIYQASQAIYEEFDRVTVLYDGRQIYFGPANEAKEFFERQGWYCPPRQTTGDFLTAVTNPGERKARPGMEGQVPRTAQEFQQYWRNSLEFKELNREIAQYQRQSRIVRSNEVITDLRSAKNFMQAKHVRPKSPYTISLPMQVRLTTKRAYQRIWNDKSATASQAMLNIIIALIVGSVFYGTADITDTFKARGSVLFLAVLINALSTLSEIISLYSQRPIVEKHASYAFYHPATEAVAGIVADIPIKFTLAVAFNLVLYFLAGLRREPGPFFLYFLITFILTFVMSGIFRTMAAVTSTVSQAMSLAGIMVLVLAIYTGFAIAVPQMGAWFSWLRWLNPVFYAFEILIANEFHHREFKCGTFIPDYLPRNGTTFICSAVGAYAGNETVSGDDYIRDSYVYFYSHVWRNFGILIAFLIFFLFTYVTATELNSSSGSTAIVLVFRRGRRFGSQPEKKREQEIVDVQSSADSLITDMAVPSEHKIMGIEPQRDMFTWRDVVYDIEIKGNTRRLLDNVAGWARPGTLTALMGVSGAGKTTLLDVLAQRTTMGVITGDMLVNGKPLSRSFQRNTGYVQQQDLHLETATVRESLRFSAVLRQPRYISKAEKYAFVEEVITMLNMEDFADAVVGVPGEGLNVEQRKLLSIGVELAAKPKLLLFLDEPTSGLDSQSSWAICSFLRKLADSGQAVLCTIHQPSALLFQQFDRLLFLARGGKTIYFGDIGPNSRIMLDYFEERGARPCDDQENPAEYMLEVVNEGVNDRGEDWHELWKASPERQAVNIEIDHIHASSANQMSAAQDQDDQGEFAAPFLTQLQVVTYRIFQQYWRMPSYIGAKWGLATAAGIFIGFSFWKAKSTQAGMSNVMFGVFMIATLFSPFVQQIQPLFTTQRSLYEVRERPSKVYSWQSFLIANTIVELPYQVIAGIIVFASVYYPITGIQSPDRQGLVLLFIIQFFLYSSTFAHMTVAALPNAETAGALVTLLVLMSLIFCGVFQTPTALPGFWIFMYRLSPFTYWIGGIVGTQLHDRHVDCSVTETSIFDPRPGQDCQTYMADFLYPNGTALGYLQNPNATEACRYCSLSKADDFLAPSGIYWDDRWRNFGLVWVYIVFNVMVTVGTYYLFRVARWGRK
ncbi:ABC-2 type transporter-domain-containing protein [Annulohypoxylon maeteangense]|uniref:ABC-2 type transporter-domain-containing protein n=1 Tax=Annulohypoxylon maeteangense TaxID=1927788 RepID=UPI002007AB10|nr:ABC-2 type transporter-domain-containing protein [Annulohypoxylon maeteangense]KAI0889730.1 ABC-2 type transporter-domain-containing protein [Annulohypoxylon maeteangense]